jgi:hypothetical protein
MRPAGVVAIDRIMDRIAEVLLLEHRRAWHVVVIRALDALPDCDPSNRRLKEIP